MKRILRPGKTVAEKAEYVCDFTGKKLGDSTPVHIEIWCGYPSNRDGVTYRLHLSDDALDEMMVYLRLRLLPRKVRDTGSYYFEGCHRQRVRSGPEDLMSKRQLQAAVRRQIG
jgi:hypothetical protein